MSDPLPTPCIGTCSTVFGDEVCRGCRRYLHEIQAWNSYDADLKARVWLRLESELQQVFSRHYRIVDARLLQAQPTPRALAHTSLAYHAVALLRRRPTHDPRHIGLLALRHGSPEHCLADLLDELYTLAQAHYERSYRRCKGATGGKTMMNSLP